MSSLFTNAQPPAVVASVDLARYAGKWYEIASYPQRYQNGCFGTTAEYTPSSKGYVIVENQCRKDSVTGPVKGIKGKAFVVKGSNNAKLKVQFFWPFRGDYWIIDLALDYQYAVVSDPSRKSLWILYREPVMSDLLYKEITDRLTKNGYDIKKLKMTQHLAW